MGGALQQKERMLLDVSVTSHQRNALMSILKAMDIEAKEHTLTEEEEDLALGLAMEEGKNEGVASEDEKKRFESFLFEE